MIGASEWFYEGGPVMPALLIVGVLLYALLFERGLRFLQGIATPEGGFVLIRALIGAAPLLGLFGTVSGLIESFDALVEDAQIR
ncbi:MAG: MotA/TolQ/ExbB proton channel family protein, partial [Myxococcota bacterium]